MNWWSNATEQQKLAQIDGGIECGMTTRQIAMNCGATRAAVASYGRDHGRTFPAKSELRHSISGGKVQRIMQARRAGAPNTLMTDAFSIFDQPKKRGLFDPHPYDEGVSA